jgi:metal-responsive CopG/Arc/MetJ family transcriptional regulator
LYIYGIYATIELRKGKEKGGNKMTTQRVNMDLDKDLWKQVGIRAIEEGINKKDLVEKALTNYLKEEEKMKTYYSVVIDTNPRAMNTEEVEYKGNDLQAAIKAAEHEWDRMNKQDKSHHMVEVRDIIPVDYDEDGEVLNYDWDVVWERA